MKILVVGNINSGKSTVVAALSKILPNYEITQIDEIRKQVGDGSHEKEYLAQQLFINKVCESRDIIAELSGCGQLAEKLNSRLPKNSYIVLKVNTDLQVCLNRCINKNFTQIPYPASIEKISQTIIRIDNELKNNSIEKLWNENALTIFTINSFNNIKALPLSHYHFLHQIIDTLLGISEISEIVSFGSLARNQLTLLSDIDLCAITDLTVYEIEKTLEKIKDITFIDTTLNKVTIRFNEILIEIVVCKKLEEIEKFYTNSMISDIKHSIIKGGENTFLSLKKMNDDFTFDKVNMKSETIKRLMFTFLSLTNIIKNDDDYRFYFNCNIIIHEVMKLYAFSKNKFAYSYLPKMATENIDFEISSLVYDFKIDKKLYICRLANSLIKVLTDVECYEKKYIEILKSFL